jgi:hypothetical protein
LNPFSKNYHHGFVYKDPSGRGTIDKSRYLKTTPEQDKIASQQLKNQEGQEGLYENFTSNDCRGFSEAAFDAFKESFENQKSSKKAAKK